jgi:hypothetical protein
MPETLQFNDFHALLNQAFQIETDAGTWVAAALVEARELGDALSEGRMPFSIVFRMGQDVRLPQKIYTIQHEALGEQQIFMVPLQPDANGNYYEAVFT